MYACVLTLSTLGSQPGCGQRHTEACRAFLSGVAMDNHPGRLLNSLYETRHFPGLLITVHVHAMHMVTCQQVPFKLANLLAKAYSASLGLFKKHGMQH